MHGENPEENRAHKKTWTDEETTEKKSIDKKKREQRTAEKVAALALAANSVRVAPESARNPAAAYVALDMTPALIDGAETSTSVSCVRTA
jgi:hypothetical protein